MIVCHFLCYSQLENNIKNMNYFIKLCFTSQTHFFAKVCSLDNSDTLTVTCSSMIKPLYIYLKKKFKHLYSLNSSVAQQQLEPLTPMSSGNAS